MFNDFYMMSEYYAYQQIYDYKTEKYNYGWRLFNVAYDNIYYVDFGHGKKILVVDDNGYIIPTKDSLIVQLNNKSFTNHVLLFKNDENLSKKLISFYFEDNYIIHPETNNQWSIRSKYGVKVIHELFDTIYFNDSFIIGKRNKKCDVYNTRLDKLSKKSTRAAYPISGFRIQLLEKNKLKIIDVMGNNAKSQKENYIVCGTVNYYTYKITGDTLVVRVDKSLTKGKVLLKKYSLSILNADSIFFLNNSKQLEYDDNSSNSYLTARNWIIVAKGNKIGISKFNETDGIIEFKEILPVEFDSIVPNGYNHPIKLLKNGLYSYFLVNNLQYKNLESFDNFFCRYKKQNGQNGWLDLKGNEYPDKW